MPKTGETAVSELRADQEIAKLVRSLAAAEQLVRTTG
jgi:hypothetical protein